MAIRNTLRNSSRGGAIASTAGSSTGGTNFGRVVDIILDDSHPDYETLGKTQALNGVFYRELDMSSVEDELQTLKFAYCGERGVIRPPLKNEIVVLQTLPSEERTEVTTAKKLYWTKAVPLWNHPHHNAYPDVIQFEDQARSGADLGEDFEESEATSPLQIFPGDVIIEGRHGNKIRLGGTKHTLNTFTDDSNNGSPYIILSNGLKEPPNAIDPIVEDINEDPSSVYIGADHTFELKQAHEKRDAWEEEPEKADQFKGNQVIINSGRLYFNAKEEGAFISATEGIGLNAKAIGIDADDYVGLDAKKLYLGTQAFKEKEPVLLGETSIAWMDDHLSQFETIVKGMATAPPAPPAFVAKMIATSNAVLPIIPQLRNLLKELLSKKVYTE
mgnify:CR=1 FL=1